MYLGMKNAFLYDCLNNFIVLFIYDYDIATKYSQVVHYGIQ